MENLKILLIVFSSILLFIPQSISAQNKRPISPKNVQTWDADLLVTGGTIVTMDKENRLIKDGAIAVKNSKIILVGKSSAVSKNLRVKETINANGKVIIPGLVNAHTHLPMVLFRGISDDLDLNEWLTKFIFPAEAKNVNEEFVRAGTRLGLAELIRGGTTTYCDMYYFEDAIADETAKAGVRGVLGQTLIDFPVPDAKTFDEGLAKAESFLKKWQGNNLIIPALAPHAPYTVSTENLNKVKAVSDNNKAPIVIHVAETRKEVSDITEKYGTSPVNYLEKIGFLNDRVIAAHTVHLTDEEIDILKAKEVGSAHCPQSNMKLASGVAPIPQMLKKNVRLGLGTDGAASNNDLNLWEEIDAAAKLHKNFWNDPKLVSAQEAFTMATIGGARALHLEDKIGSLEAGKQADIVIVDFDNFHQIPSFNIYSTLVYATKAGDVNTVIINGKAVMKERKLLTLNENAIKRDANVFRQNIINSLASN